MKARTSWRRAGRGAVDWVAWCEPLPAEAVGTIAPGLRLHGRGADPDPDLLRALATRVPLDRVPRSRLVDDAVVLVVESGVRATDELLLLAWRADADAWRLDFRLRRVGTPDLDPAPGRMWVWTTLDFAAAQAPGELEFALAAETTVARFGLRLTP